MKVAICLGLVVVASVFSVSMSQQPQPNSVRGGLRMFKLDRGCAMVGGICMDIDDCDPEHLSTTTGLCPSHKNKNVECCYRYKHRANSTCDSYQGECMSYCHPLIRHKTNDCGDQWCCTLV